VPGAEEAAEEDELAEMVGGVVGDEEGFAEEVLAFAPPEGFIEVGAGVLDEGFEVFEVGVDRGDGLVPGVGIGRLVVFGPVVVGPLDGVVAAGRGCGEVEDVALGDAEMLEKLPGRVRKICRNGTAEIGGEIFDGFVEGDVGLTAFKERGQLLA
jgi:hypothetical protein